MKGFSSRRHFIQQMSGTALALAAANSSLAFADQADWQKRMLAANHLDREGRYSDAQKLLRFISHLDG